MAEGKRPKLPSFISPKGTFVYPRLGEPDTKFKAEGEYSVKLRLVANDPATKDFLAKLEPLHREAEVEGKKQYSALKIDARKKLDAKGGYTINSLFTPVYDKETEEETGEIELNFKMKASGVRKKDGKPWSQRPKVLDASKKEMDGKKIWGGTVGRVAFEAGPYFIPAQGAAGLSLYLQAVQVIELVSGGQRDYGFDEEDGYRAPDEEPAESETEETSASENPDF